MPGAFDDLGGQAAALVEAPQDVLERCEQSAGVNGRPRTFLVPSELAEPFALIAYRGTPPRGRRRTLPQRARSRKRIVASLAALVLAGVVAAAVLASLGGDEKRERPAFAPVPKPEPGGAQAVRDEGRPIVAQSDRSRALGSPVTWNIPEAKSPNERSRRFATAAVIERVQDVISAYARAHPRAPRVGVADLSLPRGGKFGVEFGGSGHLAHQNGLEVDILYPRLDGEELAATAADQVDRGLTQDLLDRFVEAGAAVVLVDPALGLRGETSVVRPRAFHEEHMHIGFPPG